MIITRRTASRKPKKQLRQAHLGKKTATVSFDQDNILTLDYTPSTFRTVLEDVPDNRRSDFILGQSGGGGSVLISKTITANGIYDASDDNADGYDSVNVNVPQGVFPSGTVSITSNGTTDVTNYVYASVNVPQGVFPSGTVSITSNGTTDVTNYEYASVNVPNPSTGSLSISANGTYDVTSYASADVNVPNPSTGTKTVSISSNGTTTEDVTNYASVQINASVPNTYTAGDEGKVVSSGALVSQSSATYTANNTYDTTLINSVTVNVSGSGYDLLDIVTRTEPSGDVVLDSVSDFNVRTYFFQLYTGITSFSSNRAKQLHGYAFQKCSNMISVNCPNCNKLEASVFEDCSKLTNITLSNNYSVAVNCFRNCTLLQDFECWASGTASNMFYGDTSLRFVDFKNLNLYRLESNCFQNCSALVTLVLRKTSDVVGLAAASAFNGTPFANGGSGGTIYVPTALLSTYPTSTNWSTVNGYGTITWQAIEGSIYE